MMTVSFGGLVGGLDGLGYGCGGGGGQLTCCRVVLIVAVFDFVLVLLFTLGSPVLLTYAVAVRLCELEFSSLIPLVAEFSSGVHGGG